MNVLVKHNNVTITSRVIAYSREHQICSGIGTLTITLDGTYSTSIVPWDTIDIHENGDFKVRYYVSQVTKNAPDGTKTLECQDISKRLVDYFIPDSYTIDYPSYTRTWIERFLDDAGISYEFQTTSQGNLLSNYTNLGLQSGYDQIMMLLQLSGWYMYFDGNGKAIIGSLDVNLADVADKYNKTDILTIKKISNDKMLRNRAVVWGQYDSVRSEYAYADISKRTPWNYDSRDQRAIVISNNNIPNKSSAINIANILIKEFTKPTIEKHITLWGARDINLGDAVNINTNIWRGKGLVTTFGVTMNRNGLITNIVLDERCPRLFGFFNFGDYVYVGTFGDGVWRKHIEFDPAWYNFSTGLTDLNITDLHINQDIFGAVSSSGGAFYADSNEGPWNQIIFSSFPNSENSVTESGVINYIPFSGLMARAIIVDKEINTVKFGIDTFSGINTGDYFLTYSGLLTTASGVTTSGYRGWVAEYDPFTGNLVGDIGSGIYPINYSGNYDVRVLDLENDGINDYVSIATGGGTIPNDGTNFNYGSQTNQPFHLTKDDNQFTVFPQDPAAIDKNINIASSTSTGLQTTGHCALIAVDDGTANKRYAFAIGRDGKARKWTVTKSYNEILLRWEVSGSTQTSTAFASLTGSSNIVLGIHPDHNADSIFRIYYRTELGTANSYYYVDYNAATDSWGSETLIGIESLDIPNGVDASTSKSIVINNISYTMKCYVSIPSPSGGVYHSASELHIYMMKVDLTTSSFSQAHLIELITQEEVSGKYAWFPGANHNVGGHETLGTFNRTTVGMFQNGEGVKIIGWTEVYFSDGVTTRCLEYVFAGNDAVVQYNNIYDNTTYRMAESATTLETVFHGGHGLQLTETIGIVGAIANSTGENSFIFDGTTLSVFTGYSSIPWFWTYTKVYPVHSPNNDYYIALDPTNEFYLFDAATLDVTGTHIVPPTDFSLNSFFASPVGSFGSEIYAVGRDPDFERCLIKYNFSSFDTSNYLLPTLPSINNPGIAFGGFFISRPFTFDTSAPSATVVYVDMGEPVWDATRYLVLQRNGLDYSLIQESAKPIRVDISNSSPVLTVLDTEDTFISNFVYGNELTQVSPIIASGNEVRDYRYTLLETTSSGTIVASGSSVATQGLYVFQSGVWYVDVYTYSGFGLYMTIPSGDAERIETTNYTYPGQYLFVTTSGLNPTFYQKDNDGLVFTQYSGLPSSRATIIRCDDMI